MTTVVDELRRFAATTDKKWDGSASRFTDEQYQRSCLIDRGGDAPIKERCSLPVLEPDGTINVNALSAALGRLGQLTDVTDAQVSAAKSKLRSLYKTAGLDVPDTLADASDADRHDVLVMLGELETVDIPNVEILAAGGPYFGTGSPPDGDFFNTDFLQQLADANNALAAQVKVPIKIGHSRTQKLLRNSGLSSGDSLGNDEHPAAGWLESFRVDAKAGKLLADAKGVPKKIAELMKVKAFRSRSVEMGRVTEQTPESSGRTFDSVVTALALLGAKAPAVRTLDDVLAWYGERGQAAAYLAEDETDVELERAYAVGDVIFDTEQGCQDLMSDIASSLNGPTAPGAPPSYRYWVSDLIQTDSKSGLALVCDAAGDNATGWVVPYTIGDDGEPVPGPSNDWTLASQKWIQTATENAASALGDRSLAGVALPSSGADTSGMAETQKKELNEEQVVAFAAAFGIDESDPAKRSELVLAKFKEFSGEPETPAAPVETPPAPAPAAAEEENETPEMAALRRSAALGERAYTERRDERVAADLSVAIRQGRIDPADKPKWERFYAENEEIARESLLSIPPQPRRIFGSDEQGSEFAEATKRVDAAYGSLAGQLGIRPYTLEHSIGGQS